MQEYNKLTKEKGYDWVANQLEELTREGCLSFNYYNTHYLPLFAEELPTPKKKTAKELVQIYIDAAQAGLVQTTGPALVANPPWVVVDIEALGVPQAPPPQPMYNLDDVLDDLAEANHPDTEAPF